MREFHRGTEGKHQQGGTESCSAPPFPRWPGQGREGKSHVSKVATLHPHTGPRPPSQLLVRRQSYRLRIQGREGPFLQ